MKPSWKYPLLTIFAALSTLLIFWLPFILHIPQFWGIDFARRGMNVIVQNFDGLNFLVVAKSLYDPEIITAINQQFMTGNDPIYFSAHYPLFALIVRMISYFVSLPSALIITIIASNILLAWSLYYFFWTVLKNKYLAVLLSVIALFFPARMLSARSVGSNEPLFLFFVLTSLTQAIKGRNLTAAIMGMGAVLTRSPGILLFIGYFLAAVASYRLDWKRIVKEILPYILMPAALIMLFLYYGTQYGSVFAYFQSGDNLHLFFPPFEIFSNMQSWISDMWREDIIYLYIFYGLGMSLYIRKIAKKCGLPELAIGGYAVTYGLVLLMVAHRDIARYALPLAPVVYLGYAPYIEKLTPRSWWIAAILLIPIYLMGWQFVLGNIQPINDWSVFVK